MTGGSAPCRNRDKSGVRQPPGSLAGAEPGRWIIRDGGFYGNGITSEIVSCRRRGASRLSRRPASRG